MIRFVLVTIAVVCLASPVAAQQRSDNPASDTLAGIGLVLMAGSAMSFSLEEDSTHVSGSVGRRPVDVWVTDSNALARPRLRFVNPFGSTAREAVFYSGVGFTVTALVLALTGKNAPIRAAASPAGVSLAYAVGF